MRRLLSPALLCGLILAFGCGDNKKVIPPKDVPPTPAPGTLPKGGLPDQGGGKKAPGDTSPPPPKL